MKPQLTLSTLGDLVIQLDGETVTSFPTRKVEALLVYLAVERASAHRRESLFTLLWPGMPESSARNNLRKTIPEVASNVGDDPVPLLVSDRHTVQIDPDADVEVDLNLIDKILDEIQYHDHLNLADCETCIKGLKQAVDLYRGEFLAGFYLDDSTLFDDWAGLAKVKFAQGDKQSAREYGQLVQNYLQESPRLAMAEHPMCTFRFTWDLWMVLGETVAADDVLTLATAVIQDYLEVNSDTDLQAMYLRQPHHAVLWGAWREKTTG